MVTHHLSNCCKGRHALVPVARLCTVIVTNAFSLFLYIERGMVGLECLIE